MSYHQFTIDERESILVYRMHGLYFFKLLNYFIVIRLVLVVSGNDV